MIKTNPQGKSCNFSGLHCQVLRYIKNVCLRYGKFNAASSKTQLMERCKPQLFIVFHYVRMWSTAPAEIGWGP